MGYNIYMSYLSGNYNMTRLNLNNFLKNIADSYLHRQIQEIETIPNKTMVAFNQYFDVLLGEIIRIIK